MSGKPPRRLKAQMRRDILKVYPQLGEIESSTLAGTMAYAVHKMPQIGELAPGYWLAGAFGGHGLNTTAMAGEMIRARSSTATIAGGCSPHTNWCGPAAGSARAGAVGQCVGEPARGGAERISRYRDRARRESDARQARWAAEKTARQGGG